MTDQLDAWARDGFFVVRSLIDEDTASDLLDAARRYARDVPDQPDVRRGGAPVVDTWS